ncbi:ABC transporter substrate-binding protein [Bacillus benzoevorans]|uniref:Iron complex transport system substrate-binding protein n=1 Tax=Bacillus benzoevorans TaxID=1456 RepID=A0A7X0HY13_9BACI|nr:ABC transporter substrate-binding protein [Bacillus benzoevorans]MBB6447696.1 iron complex transport system substrate-binding protein [Bacillus benzoevorans]
MRKIYSLLFILLLSIFVVAGCGAADKKEVKGNDKTAKTEQAENGAFPVTIQDAADKEVVIEEKPEKIVSLMPSNTEIAFALGLGGKIVGVTDNDNYPEEVKEKEKVGGMEFNIEKIISLKPDLVLGFGGQAMGSSADGLQQLRDAGITVLVVNDATSFADVYKAINMVGTATGTKEEAETIVADMKAKVDEIKEKAAGIKEEDKKQVYIEVSPDPLYAAGTSTFMNEMLDIIHAENVVKEEGWPSIDQEAIIAANPDVILTTYGFYIEDPVGMVTGREGWQNLDAVKNKHIVDVDSDTVTRSGPRLVEGVEEVAKAVYPEIFK